MTLLYCWLRILSNFGETGAVVRVIGHLHDNWLRSVWPVVERDFDRAASQDGHHPKCIRHRFPRGNRRNFKRDDEAAMATTHSAYSEENSCPYVRSRQAAQSKESLHSICIRPTSLRARAQQKRPPAKTRTPKKADGAPSKTGKAILPV